MDLQTFFVFLIPKELFLIKSSIAHVRMALLPSLPRVCAQKYDVRTTVAVHGSQRCIDEQNLFKARSSVFLFKV